MQKGSIFAHGSAQQLPRSAVSRTSARKGERKRHTVWTDPQHMTAMVGFAGFDNNALVRPAPALLDGAYGSPKPPTTCTGSDERTSSCASPTPTAISSPRSDGASL